MSPKAPATSSVAAPDPCAPCRPEPVRRLEHAPIGGERSWPELDARVLEEARDEALPVFERLEALAVFSSRLDELFMARVAGLKRDLAAGVAAPPGDAPPAEQLAAIAERTQALLDVQGATWRDGILPALARASLRLVRWREMAAHQREAVRRRFVESIFPALTPLAVGPGHPFPRLGNGSLNLAFVLARRDGRRRRSATSLLSIVQIPSALPRLVPVPAESGRSFALLEDVVAEHVGDLFPGHAASEAAPFRVTRSRKRDSGHDEPEDLLSTMQAELRRRDRGAVVRLELAAGASRDLEAALAAALALGPRDVFRIAGPLRVSDLLALRDGRRPELLSAIRSPAPPLTRARATGG